MRKKKSTQQLVGIESVTDSSVLTAGGELTFYSGLCVCLQGG